MGKVKANIAQDDEAIAEWVYRKLCNHDPMAKREAEYAKKHMKITTNVEQPAQRVAWAPGSASVIYALSDGRVFRIEVAKISGATTSEAAMAD